MYKYLEEKINQVDVRKAKYFNYFEVTLGYAPCEMHLGEWMWTDDFKVLLEHFDLAILKASLLEIKDNLELEIDLDRNSIPEIIEVLKESDEKANQINYQRIVELRNKLFNYQNTYKKAKTIMEDIVTRINVLGVDVTITLCKGYKEALKVIIEHDVELDLYDINSDEDLNQLFAEDVIM